VRFWYCCGLLRACVCHVCHVCHYCHSDFVIFIVELVLLALALGCQIGDHQELNGFCDGEKLHSRSRLSNVLADRIQSLIELIDWVCCFLGRSLLEPCRLRLLNNSNSGFDYYGLLSSLLVELSGLI